MKIEKRSKYDSRKDSVRYFMSACVTGLIIFGFLVLITL